SARRPCVRVSPASRRSPAPRLLRTRSPRRASSTRSRSRSGSLARRARRSRVGREAVGPYTLLRVDRGGLDPGEPGQFFMLSPPGRLLPRPMSLCLHEAGELGFLIDVVGPGTRSLAALEPGEELNVFG